MQNELEKLRADRDKFMWQVRDTCARAERAEQALAERDAEIVAYMNSIEPDEETAGGPASWGDFLQILEGVLQRGDYRSASDADNKGEEQ